MKTRLKTRCYHDPENIPEEHFCFCSCTCFCFCFCFSFCFFLCFRRARLSKGNGAGWKGQSVGKDVVGGKGVELREHLHKLICGRWQPSAADWLGWLDRARAQRIIGHDWAGGTSCTGMMTTKRRPKMTEKGNSEIIRLIDRLINEA